MPSVQLAQPPGRWGAGLLALALAGLVLQLYATVWGGGVSPDSTQYIEGARSLLRGEGISAPDGAGVPQPITLWPPLMPVLLAAPGLAGVDPAVTGRILTALLFAANIALVGWVLFQATGGSTAAALAGAALVLLSPDLFEVHTWIWSEPLFILLCVAGCTALAAYLQRPSAGALWLAATAAGLAGLTRFAGAALGLAGIGVIIALARLPDWRRRAVAALTYGLVSLGPLALWMLRNLLVAGSATTRDLGFHRLYSVHFLPGLEAAAAWLLPGGSHTPLRVALLAAFVIAVGVLGIRHARAGRLLSTGTLQLLPHSLVAFLASYGALLLFSKFYVDPHFPLDDRILAPALAAVIVLTVQLAALAWRRGSGRRIRPLAGWLLAGVVAAQFGLGARQVLDWAATGHEKGLGYNSVSWQTSSLVGFVRALPPRAQVFSNADDGLLFSTGHPVWRLPAGTRGQPQAWTSQIGSRLDGREAYVVYFDAITWRDTLTPGDLQQQFALETQLQAEEGTVLRISPHPEE